MVVLDFLHRWIFNDFWVPVWPNLAASVLTAIHVTRSNRKHATRFYLGNKPGSDDKDEHGTIR